MPCFCKNNILPVRSSLAGMKFNFTPPSMPLALQAAATIPSLAEESIDLKMVMAIQSYRLPNVNMGPAAPVLGSLHMAMGGLKLTSLEAIEADLSVTVNSFESNVLPRLRSLSNLIAMPLVQLASIGGLLLRLKVGLGVDPLTLDAKAFAEATSSAAQPSRASVSIPTGVRIKAGQIAALYPMVKLAEDLKLDVGEAGMVPATNSFLRGIARIRPSGFNLNMIPQMQKMALALTLISTVKEAFGVDALTSAGQSRVSSSLRLMNRFSPPIPGLKVAAKIAPPPLPPMETMEAVMNTSWHGPMTMKMTGMSFPILPPLRATGSLALALQNAFKLETLTPGACPACAFG